MKKLFIIAATVAFGLLALYAEAGEPKAPAAAPQEKGNEAESRVQHGANGETIIHLDIATQKLMGLQTATLSATKLSPETKGFGRVMDPVVISTGVAELLSSRAASDISQKELTRLKILAEQNNTSARALEAAEGAAQRDGALVETARAKLFALVGKTIAERTNLIEFTKSLASGESALVQVNMPAGERLDTEPTSARIVEGIAGAQPVAANFAGSPLGVDPQTQSRTLLFLVETNESRLAPGAAVTGFLKSAGEIQSGVTMPRDAIIRFNGAKWFYLQTGDETFQRTEIELKRPLEGGWFASPDLKPDAKVVIVGGQQLLSEELKGQLSGE